MCALKEAQVKQVTCQEVKLYPLGWSSVHSLDKSLASYKLSSWFSYRFWTADERAPDTWCPRSCERPGVLPHASRPDRTTVGTCAFPVFDQKRGHCRKLPFSCFGILCPISKLLKLTLSTTDVNHSVTLVVQVSLANKHVTTNVDMHSPDSQNCLGTIQKQFVTFVAFNFEEFPQSLVLFYDSVSTQYRWKTEFTNTLKGFKLLSCQHL